MNKNRWISVIAAIGLIVTLLTYMPAVPAAAATDGSIKAGVNGVYNQDFDKHTILIEIGGQDNTVDEVLNSSIAFARCFMEVIKTNEG